MSKPASKSSPLIGKWRLVATESWTQKFIDLIEPGFIELKANGRGTMVFGTANLALDWKTGEDDKLEFTFEVLDGIDGVSGKGCVLVSDEQMFGEIKTHLGNRYALRAQRWVEMRKANKGRSGQ